MKKERVKLYAVNKNNPDIELDFDVVENLPEVIDEYADSEIIYAKKTAIVDVRMAKEGELVDTNPRAKIDGVVYTFSETKQTITKEKADNHAVIVKNPDGEEYVISSVEKFDKKYKQGPNGFYAVDGVKPFRRVREHCVIKTDWGKQYAPKGSYFCVQNKDDVYSVTNEAFEKTYSPVEIKLDKEEELEGGKEL